MNKLTEDGFEPKSILIFYWNIILISKILCVADIFNIYVTVI